MPLELSVVSDSISLSLSAAGIESARVEIEPLDADGKTLLITVFADVFEGQTYLDREIRIRPLVARALVEHGLTRSNYVIDARTLSEISFGDNGAENPSLAELSEPGAGVDRINRNRWARVVESVKRALQNSGYSLDDLESNVFVAERKGLVQEKLLIGYADRVNAKVVDLQIRKTLQTAQSSQKFSGHYYLTPAHLDAPFSNQKAARWLDVVSAIQFLHRLSASRALAERLKALCEAGLNPRLSEFTGPIVEPVLRVDVSEGDTAFFTFVHEWMKSPGSNLMVLMAPAGHGKTTLLQELSRQFADAFLKGRESSDALPVPLLVPFESVRRIVDFEALMYKRLGELCAGSYGAFTELLKSGRAILLVDGFDELADDAGTSVAEAQVRSMRPLLEGEAKVILAGRTVFTQLFAGEQSVAKKVRALVGDIAVTEAEILPFDADKVHEYVCTRQGISTQQRDVLLRYVEISPDHAELAANPLFLKFLTGLAVSNALPDTPNSVEQVDTLLARVCEREEERQHLGIGTSEQLNFLGWIALEIFKSARTAISKTDVELMASEILQAIPGASGTTSDVTGRLVDHALLNTHGSGEITFIHPLIRDVLLARAIATELLVSSGRVAPRSPLTLRDLPEGTVHHLAFGASDWLQVMRNVERLPTQARRNVLRIAMRAALTNEEVENPRGWLRSNWGDGERISGTDFSLLHIESVSFDRVSFVGCDLSSAVFVDCDFREAVFENCKLDSVTFVDCRSADVRVFGGVVTGVLVMGEADGEGSPVQLIDGIDDMMAALSGERAVVEGPRASGSTLGVLRRCRDLISVLLHKLVEVEPVVKFHTISEEDLRDTYIGDGRERVVVNKVIIPLLVNRLCSRRMVAKSKGVVSLSKHWQPSVVAFLRDESMSRKLNEFIQQCAAKAARFWV